MEPISFIVGAIASGAAAGAKEVASQSVKDAYQFLKKKLLARYGEKGDVADAVEKLEKNPESKARKDLLHEELQGVKISEDDELVNLASKLSEEVKASTGGSVEKYSATQSGGGVLVQGKNNTVAGQGGTAIGGNAN